MQSQGALGARRQYLDEDSLAVSAVGRHGQGPVATECDPEVITPCGIGGNRRTVGESDRGESGDRFGVAVDAGGAAVGVVFAGEVSRRAGDVRCADRFRKVPRSAR